MNDQNSTANDSDLKVDFDQRTGSSMSTKDGGDNKGWEKESEHPTTPSYLATSPYTYPDSFTAVPTKMNGHLNSNSDRRSFGNYVDHAALVNHQLQQQTSPSSIGLVGIVGMAGVGGGGVGGGGYLKGSNGIANNISGSVASYPSSPAGGVLTSSQHSLYSGYGEFDPGKERVVETEPGFSPGYNNSFTNQNFNSSSGSLPLSLQVSARPTGSPGGTGSSIPRLGIPVDPSQYIVPPRAQVLQGALATHV
ncbi:uncharacterized protein [Palaemon carinicauda]|uniref:uncharacterized protein n=1 Tax=Palaemon carinicauda TaxID=392227 RepID=UPI0035B63338